MEQVYVSPNYPNQSFTIVRDGNIFDIGLRTFRGMTYATINKNQNNIITSMLVADRKWLLPYPSDWKDCGNFRFECESSSYPHYKNFGTTCNLVYYTHEEAEALGQ